MDDLIAELEQVRRSVGRGTVPAGDGHLVELWRTYDAAVEDVWDACTEPDRLSRWFLPVTGDLRVGGRYQFEGNAGGTINECEPPRRVAATWEFAGDVSLVDLELTPVGDGRTELRLRHAVPDNDHWATFGPGAVGVGWDGALLGLGLFLRGAEVPRDPDALASPELRAFFRRGAQAWGEAHRESGVSAETAAEAAERTAAAYAPEPDPAEPSAR